MPVDSAGQWIQGLGGQGIEGQATPVNSVDGMCGSSDERSS